MQGGKGGEAPRLAVLDRPAGARRTRPAWWRELGLVLLTYAAYTLTRNTLPENQAAARRHARELYRVERQLHLDVERWLNDLVAGPTTNVLSLLSDYAYSVSHVAVTVGVLVWLYLARPDVYRTARNVLLATTLLALVGFWLYPLAPPRFFPGLGFVDTVVRDRTWGSWGSTAVAETSNQLAAMPSLHLAWALWSAGAVVVCARTTWVRVVAPVYPVAVAFVILGTANHWVLDAVGGLLVTAAGLVVALGVERATAVRRWR